jgi:nucleoside 2-deoxyribosyltransferase
MPISLYLAGPELFHPDGAERADRMRALCIEHGFAPISPLDAGDDPIDGSPVAGRSLAEMIFCNNLAMIRRADVVVANLGQFRGPDPDPGTAFELGYGYALGKRCVVYSDDGDTALERVERFYGPVSHRADGTPIDRDGLSIEDFGAPFNLMLSSGAEVVRGGLREALERLREVLS